MRKFFAYAYIFFFCVMVLSLVALIPYGVHAVAVLGFAIVFGGLLVWSIEEIQK